jgi:hypothetical protein
VSTALPHSSNYPNDWADQSRECRNNLFTNSSVDHDATNFSVVHKTTNSSVDHDITILSVDNNTNRSVDYDTNANSNWPSDRQCFSNRKIRNAV